MRCTWPFWSLRRSKSHAGSIPAVKVCQPVDMTRLAMTPVPCAVSTMRGGLAPLGTRLHSHGDGRPKEGISVAASAGRGTAELAGALVTKEVVARQDVVHLQTFRAGEPLADVTLKEGVVADHLVPAPIRQAALGRRAVTRLAVGGRVHGRHALSAMHGGGHRRRQPGV